MSENLEKIKLEAIEKINNSKNLHDLEQNKVFYLGKNGFIAEKMKLLSTMSIEEKKSFGSMINAIKQEITSQLEQKTKEIENRDISDRLSKESIDISLPVRPETQGKIHPISYVIEEVTNIFSSMGFSVAEGPDVENDHNNFTALNIPEDHPARQMHDTFYVKKKESGKNLLLRTHTSSVQIRTMSSGKPPFKFIAPGRTYRSDSDMTHSPMFHQIEAFYVDKNVNMGNLKYCINEFLKKFFGLDNVPMRFRASFFPFTEPSAEVDIGCTRSADKIKIGEGSDWLEIMGCGMIHPNVLKNCNINPEEYSGFALGMGVERIAMLKYGIPDLRTFFESDVRWLKHYGFSFLDNSNLTSSGF